MPEEAEAWMIRPDSTHPGRTCPLVLPVPNIYSSPEPTCDPSRPNSHRKRNNREREPRRGSRNAETITRLESTNIPPSRRVLAPHFYARTRVDYRRIWEMPSTDIPNSPPGPFPAKTNSSRTLVDN